MVERRQLRDRRRVQQAFARASEQGWGIAVGLVAGVALWAATMVLVLRGGENPGPHLAMLGVYFPGYRVTVPGAFIGFIYLFVVGYAIGRTVAGFYNRLSRTRPVRHPRP